MRELLAARTGTRGTYYAIVTGQTRLKTFRDHLGNERSVEMMLLTHVLNAAGVVVTDHLWWYSTTLKGVGEGDTTRFVASVSPYRKKTRAEGWGWGG